MQAKKRKRLPPQLTPMMIERSYTRELHLIIMEVREALKPLLNEIPILLRDIPSIYRYDAGEGKKIKDLADKARKTLAKTVTPDRLKTLARKFGERTSVFQKAQLAKQTKAAIGVEIIGKDKKLAKLMERFVSTNVSLITNIPERIVGELEATINRAVQLGTSTKELGKQIASKFEIEDKKAAGIARDQVGTFYGQLNATRQQDLGIEKFIWRTVGDERVRPEHRSRDGQEYSYKDPPSGELPGTPINCRCWAEPVIDDILNAA